MAMLLLASNSAVLAMYGMQSFGGKNNKMPQTSSNTDENVQQMPSMNSGGTTDAGRCFSRWWWYYNSQNYSKQIVKAATVVAKIAKIAS